MDTNPPVTFKLNNDDECILYPPIITEEFLIGRLQKPGNYCRTIDLKEPYSIAFNGSKGSGKTALLALLACCAMCLGIPVFSNFPIAIYIINKEKQIRLLQATILDLRTFIKLSNELNYSLVVISEYQNWANAYRSNSNVNMALGKILQQMRKKEMSIYYDVQEENWVDPVTRVIADVNVWCENLFYRFPKKYDKGETFRLTMWDNTGKWTGFPHRLFPRPPIEKDIYFKPFWGPPNPNEIPPHLPGIFDTHYVLDPWETLSLKGDNFSDLITGGNGHKPKSYTELKETIASLAGKEAILTPTETWKVFGVDTPPEQKDIRQMMFDFGVREKMVKGKKFYSFADVFEKVGVGNNK